MFARRGSHVVRPQLDSFLVQQWDLVDNRSRVSCPIAGPYYDKPCEHR